EAVPRRRQRRRDGWITATHALGGTGDDRRLEEDADRVHHDVYQEHRYVEPQPARLEYTTTQAESQCDDPHDERHDHARDERQDHQFLISHQHLIRLADELAAASNPFHQLTPLNCLFGRHRLRL